jgi:hypothetical protein
MLEGYSGLVLQSHGLHQRRESFLYRSDSEYDAPSPRSMSRASSITSASDVGVGGCHEDYIVTPFAQILASLRTIRANYIHLTNIPAKPRSANDARTTANSGGKDSNATPTRTTSTSEDPYVRTAMETLDELDWCLDQLETMQTHTSVSGMASTKFKRMLNKELNNFSESRSGGAQVSEYIYNTFISDGTHEIDYTTPSNQHRGSATGSGLQVPPSTPASTKGGESTPSPVIEDNQRTLASSSVGSNATAPTERRSSSSTASEMFCDSLLVGWDPDRETRVENGGRDDGSADDGGADDGRETQEVMLPYSRMATNLTELHKVS